MSQEKTLYLHIGLPKTGTTSIQNYLFENREALMQRGVCYPKPLASVGHHAEALLFFEGEASRDHLPLASTSN